MACWSMELFIKPNWSSGGDDDIGGGVFGLYIEMPFQSDS